MDELAVVEPGGPDNLAGVARPLRASQRRGLLVAVMGSLTKTALDTIGGLGAPGAPLVLITTRPDGAAPTRSSSGVIMVDGTAGAFARAWDAAMITRGRASGRAAQR